MNQVSVPFHIKTSSLRSNNGDADPEYQILGKKIVLGLHHIIRGQHPNGEILSFRRDVNGNYQYFRSPFVSTFVHEALGCFDSFSPLMQPGSLELVPAETRQWFQQTVIQMRRRIRNFLAWQQEAEGWWRFFGRGSGIDPDVNTTVCAATALRERDSKHWLASQSQQYEIIQRFRAANGLYYTFFKIQRGGYAWMDDFGFPIVGFDRVVNADVLGFLASTGWRTTSDLQPLIHFINEEIEADQWLEGTLIYPNPLSFPFAVARAWRQGDLPDHGELVERLLPKLISRGGESGDFGSPLSAALAGITLINLDCWDDVLHVVCRAIMRNLQEDGSKLYEDFVIDGFGAPALTAALSISCLARYHCLVGGIDK